MDPQRNAWLHPGRVDKHSVSRIAANTDKRILGAGAMRAHRQLWGVGDLRNCRMQKVNCGIEIAENY